MDIQLASKIYESIQLLIGKVAQIESRQESLKEIIDEKINPTKKEFITDSGLHELGITKHQAYKLVQSGSLKKYKLRGKGSTSFYRYEQVMNMITNGLVNPKSKET